MYNDCGTQSTVALNAQLNGSKPDGVSSVYPFAGVVSTPVIDTNLPTPAIFLTSLCQTINAPQTSHWYLHELKLTDGSDIGTPVQITGSASGTADADDYSQTTHNITFNANEVLQRAALLEVSNANSTTSPVIYMTFGTAVPESYQPAGGNTVTSYPYHGWVFGATVASGTQQLSLLPTVYATTPTGPTGNTGTPPCAVCPATASGSTAPSTCVYSGYENSPSWCGHSGGSWGGASRGPAAITLGSGSSAVTHAFVGVGNGPFQMQCNGGSCTTLLNAGDSILDFQLPSSNPGYPSALFAPYGGGANILQTANLLGLPVYNQYTCPNEGSNPCQYLTEILAENDWDGSQSGILIFYSGGFYWLVTVDKAGYGYLLHPGNLGGWTSGDAGNLFPFGAANTLCQPNPQESSNACDRVTSLAFYNNTLFFWPNKELLTALQFSATNATQTGSGTLSVQSTVTSATVSQSNQIIAGDQINVIIPAGQVTQTVTAVVNSGGQQTLTLYPGFSSGFANTTVSAGNWKYNGYFVNPHFDTRPSSGTYVQYPGGTVQVTGNSGADGVVWGLALIQTGTNHGVPVCTSVLAAYDATSSDTGQGGGPAFMELLWSNWDGQNCVGNCFYTVPQNIPNLPPQVSTQGCNNGSATFALPTIANGNIYIHHMERAGFGLERRRRIHAPITKGTSRARGSPPCIPGPLVFPLKEISMINHYLRIALALAFCAIIITASLAGQATYKVIAQMNQIGSPIGLTEGSPVYSIRSGQIPQRLRFR